MNELKIKDLNFIYKNKNALNNINLTLNNGLTALLGPNGAGKSTLMKLLVTLFEANKDTIYLNGVEYNENKNMIKTQLSYVPQDFDMYKNISGIEYLEFVAKMKNINENNLNDEINKVVVELDLNDFINKKIGTYSGGVKRRLGIAQAIIGNPKLIIMDEPTVGLDPKQRNEFRRLLPLLSKDRILLISTHIVEDIQFNCDKLIVLNKGTILYDGELDDFMKQTNVYCALISKKEFDDINESLDIIDFKQIENAIEIKYSSNQPIIEGSTKIPTSLQDAYLYFLNKESIR